jgi:hypothetical protein
MGIEPCYFQLSDRPLQVVGLVGGLIHLLAWRAVQIAPTE